jgi:cell division protein FtsB
MRSRFGRVAFLAVFLAVASFAFVTLRGPHGIPALLDKNRQIELKETSNAKLAKEVERLRERIRRLEGNPVEQELEIRKRQHLMRKGEKLYIVPEATQ